MTPKIIEAITSTIDRWYGVKLPQSFVEKHLQHIPAEIQKYGLDTCVREEIAAIIGKVVCGCNWPRGLDGDAYALAFEVKLKEEAPKHGIEVNPDISLT